MFAKRMFAVILFAVAASFTAIAQSQGNVVVLQTELENMSGSEAWLSNHLQSMIVENLQKYTNFTTVVDADAERKVKEQQRRSESTAHSESDIIEIGKLVNAKFAVFSSALKAGSTYMLRIDFTDLTTGIHRASIATQKQYGRLEQLYAHPGAVDEVTLGLCERLGIALSAAQRYVLQHGEGDLSSEQQLELEKQEQERFRQQMKDLDAQIAVLNTSTQADADTQQKKLEALRAMNEQKLKAAQEREQRLLDDQKKRQADLQAEANRKEASIQRRNEMSAEIERKVKNVRAAKAQNSNIMERIAFLETKKKTFNELQDELVSRKNEIDRAADEEFNVKKAEIDARPWRAAELADGKPTSRAQEIRAKEIAELRDKLHKQAEAEKSATEKELQPTSNTLLKDIIDDYWSLEKTTVTISSVKNEKDIQYSIGTFNGEKNAWSVLLYFYNDGKESLGQYQTTVSYQSVTGIHPEAQQNRNYDEFLDTVDMYNSLFARNESVLTFEVDYTVEPWSVPSQYRVHFKEFRVRNTLNGKVLLSEAIADLNRIVSFPECHIDAKYYAHIISPKSKSVPGYILYEFALSAENGGDNVNASNLMHRAAEKGYAPALDYIAQKKADEREKLRIAAEEKEAEAERKRQEKETEKQQKKSYADMLYSSPRLGFVFNGDISLPDKSMQNYAFEIKYFRNDSERKHRKISSVLLLPILPIALLTQLPGSYAGGGVNTWINDDGFDALYVYGIIGLSAPLRRIRPYLELGGGIGGMHDEFGFYGYVKGGLEARISPHISIEAFCRPQGGFHSQEKDGESTDHYVGAVSGGIGISFWKIFD